MKVPADSSSLPAAAVLTEHVGFLRAIARSLVREDADDLVQDTLVAALERPPRGSPRAWLRVVARNLAAGRRRREARRADKESQAARREALPSVAEGAERLDLRRQVVEAVQALAEPYRSAVVYRFYYDLPLHEIAERLDVSPDTVKTRLRRALGQLRARLDRTHRGDRRRWMARLAAFSVGSSAKAAGGTFVAAGVAAVVTCGVLLYVAGSERDGGDAPERHAATTPVLFAAPDRADPPARERKRAAWTFYVHDPRGAPVANASVRVMAMPAVDPDRWNLESADRLRDMAQTGAAGRCAFPSPGIGSWMVEIGAAGLRPSRTVVVKERGDEAHNFFLGLADGSERLVRLADERKNPVAGVVGYVTTGGIAVRRLVSDGFGVMRVTLETDDELLIRAKGFRWEIVGSESSEEVVLRPEYRVGGTTVPGAVVSRDLFGRLLATVADDEGRFLLTGLGPRTVDLDVRARGYAPARVRTCPGDEKLRIPLARPASLKGRILRADRAPAAGVELNFDDLGERELPEPGAVTDAAGEFAVADLAPGLWLIRAEGRERIIDIADGAHIDDFEWRFALQPRSSVAVRVVDRAGLPVAGALVNDERTDKDGRAVVSFRKAAGERALVQAEHDGRRCGAWTRTGGPPLTLTLQPMVEVTIVVRGPGGESLPDDASCEIRITGSDMRAVSGGDAHDRRSFKVYAAPDGDEFARWRHRFDLSVTAPGYAPLRIRPFYAPPVGGEFVVKLSRGRRVRGVVTRKGEPVDGVRIYASEWQRGRLKSATRTDDDGTFEFGATPGAFVVVSAWTGGDVPGAVRAFTMPDRDLGLDRLALRPARRLRGRVVDGDGRPVGGARVVVRSRMGRVPAYSVPDFFTRVDGRFEITAPDWDQARLLVWKWGYAAEPTLLRDIDGSLEVRIAREAKLELEVATPGINRGPSHVWLRRPGADWSWHPTLKLHGRLTTAYPLPPGRWVAEVSDRGWTHTQEFTVVEGEVTRARIFPIRR